MAANNNNSSNNNINNGSLVGDQDSDNNNNSFGKNPGEETEGNVDKKVGAKATPLPDNDVEMEDIEEKPPVINDIVKAIQVALEGHNGEMARRYEDAVLRGYTALFPDGTKNIFLAVVTDTVEDVNNKLDKYFGEDAVFLGFVDKYHVIRATPSSLVDEIVKLNHIKLGFGFGAETPDDGD